VMMDKARQAQQIEDAIRNGQAMLMQWNAPSSAQVAKVVEDLLIALKVAGAWGSTLSAPPAPSEQDECHRCDQLVETMVVMKQHRKGGAWCPGSGAQAGRSRRELEAKLAERSAPSETPQEGAVAPPRSPEPKENT